VTEREDIIQKSGEVNNFLWTREIRPSTFKSIAPCKTTAIQEGKAYHPIDVSYNAWITATPLSDALKHTITTNPTLLTRNAIFDLSKTPTGGKAKMLNKTDSRLFKEFEAFLRDEFHFSLKPVGIYT